MTLLGGKKKKKNASTVDATPVISPSQLAECLRGTLSPNAQIREAAEAAVKKFTIKNQSSCVHFCRVATMEVVEGGGQNNDTAEMIGVRMAAALALKRRVSTAWVKLGGEEKAELQSGLLRGLTNERERVVRDALSQSIARIAQICIPNDSWPDVLEHLSQMSMSPEPRHRGRRGGMFFGAGGDGGESGAGAFQDVGGYIYSELDGSGEIREKTGD